MQHERGTGFTAGLAGQGRGLALFIMALCASLAHAQAPFSRIDAFDRYDPTQLSYAVEGVSGEEVDPRTLGLSWEVTDYVLPGNGGLDITISRSFGRLAHTPSDMGHWYFGVPRIQIPTSPWRGPFDPARADTPTFLAAWNNLYSRLGHGSESICNRAGSLVDAYVTGSLTGQTRGGIMFAAPITLYIPGEGSKLLLEKLPGAGQYPADALYVTTDNWIARCLPPAAGRMWGGFEVVSPAGTRYTFDFIQYLVPGEYGTLSTGGWIEMGISRIEDVHGNWLRYEYDLGAGGTDLLQRIVASDGREVRLDYHPGSVLGVDVQGSPLALITGVNMLADGREIRLAYEYCDFAYFYILNIGCAAFQLGPDNALPVLHEVRFPDGTRSSYRYHPTLYSANILLDWGGFSFLLERVTLPTGGLIRYEYQSGFSPLPRQSDSPAPRLSRRHTSGRDVAQGTWQYSYQLQNHIETVTVTGPARRDVYEFYEGVGTYEFMIARYPGQYQWPDTAPTDYDELLGRLRRHTVQSVDGQRTLRSTSYDYALPAHIGKQWYGSNWLGWPTLVLAQTRAVPVSTTTVQDFRGSSDALSYVTTTPANEFDAYGLPRVVLESGQDGGIDNDWLYRRTDLGWHHDTVAWIIGRPASRRIGDALLQIDYHPGTGLPSRRNEYGRLTEYDYYPDGNLAAERWMRDGQSHRIAYSNYHRGVAGREEYPVNPATGATLVKRREVDDLGRARWEEDFAGQRTHFSYNDMGRLLTVAAPLQATLQMQYTVTAGRLTGVSQSQGGRQRQLDLDGFGRTTLLIDSGSSNPGDAAIARRWRFDPAGRMSYRSDVFEPNGSRPEYGTELTVDEFDRTLLERYTADGSERRYCHDNACNSSIYGLLYDSSIDNGYVLTDEEGHQTGFEFASFGGPDYGLVSRIVQQTVDSSGATEFVVTRLQRDALGNITAVHQGSPAGDSLSRLYTYDSQQRLVAEDHPENGRTTYEYDERSNRIRALAGGSVLARWFYDGMNRLVRTDYPGTASDLRFAWAPNGQPASIWNAGTRWDFSYDSAGRVVEERLYAAGRQFRLGYGYDSLGHLATLAYPSGELLQLQPDDFGRPRRLGDAVTAAEWWPDGQLRRAVYGNGAITQQALTERGLPMLRDVRSAGSLVQRHDYQYDRIGNMIALTDSHQSAGNIAMAYDPLGRLSRATSYWGQLDFGYDIWGNIRTQANGGFTARYQYDASSNRLQSHGIDPWPHTQYRHDARGNVTHDGTYDFIYNSAQQLAGIVQLPGLEWQYDGRGHRTIVEQDGARDVHVYNRDGRLLHTDRCESRNQLSDFLYLGTELVARYDQPCSGGCHP